MAKKNKGKIVSRNIMLVTTIIMILMVAVVIVGYSLAQNYINKIDIIDSSVADIETIPTHDESQKESISKEIEIEIKQEIENMTDENGETLSPEEASSVYEELQSIADENAAKPPVSLIKDGNVINILLIGTDTRGNDTWVGNSDSMILCSINNAKRTIYLTSIMRDTFVNIAGVGGSKLNRAHALGGGDLLVATIEQNFGIDIDYYARVNFYSLIDIINSLGGIPLSISNEEVRVANSYIFDMTRDIGISADPYYITSGGNIHATGMQAVAYARIRYVGNADFGRTQRQRIVLSTIFNILKSSDLGTINNFLNASLPRVTTNMPADVINSLVSNATVYLNFGLNAELRIPADNIGYYSVNEMLVTDFGATNQWLRSIIY